MQDGHAKTMQAMMETMFAKVMDTRNVAGSETKAGQIDERMRGPDPFDGCRKRNTWSAKPSSPFT
jgi:hypothetical protein